MFGLTQREQRWKAEKEAAELVATIAVAALNAKTAIRIAEIEKERIELQNENNRLKALLLEKECNTQP